MHKQVFLALETSGVDPEINSLLRLTGAIIIGGRVAESFDIESQSCKGDQFDPESMRLNGLDPNKMMGFKGRARAENAHRKFVSTLAKYQDSRAKNDKFWLCAWGGSFVSDFLFNWFRKATNGHSNMTRYFYTPAVNIMTLAAARIGDNRAKMKDFKLPTVAKALGVSVRGGQNHDSRDAVRMARGIWNRCFGHHEQAGNMPARTETLPSEQSTIRFVPLTDGRVFDTHTGIRYSLVREV